MSLLKLSTSMVLFVRLYDGCEGRYECERFVIRLVGFVLRKVCDNRRAGSCDEKINGMTMIMSWKVDVLSEMEIIEDARKFVRGS